MGIYAFGSLGYAPRSQIAGLYGNFMFNHFRNCQIVSQNDQLQLCVCVSSKPYFFFFVVYFNVTAILSFSTYKATSDSSREETALCTLKKQKVAGTLYLYCAVRGTGDPRKSKDLFMFVLMYGVLRSPVQLLLKS